MSDLARTVPCPYCGAKCGQPCRVPATGRVLGHPSEGHSSRSTKYRRQKDAAALKKLLAEPR